MNSFNYILGSDSVTVFIDGNSYSVNKQAKTYDMLIAAIRSGDADGVRKAVDVRKVIVDSFSSISDKVRIEDGVIYYGDREVTGLISTRVFDMLKLNLDVAPMVRFIENMMQNPSHRAVKELFGFMEACNLPVTEDGYFLAYKRVRGDYTSVRDSKTDNSLGAIVEMPRNMVDENANQTCSHGLHFCSYDYLRHFSGERIVVLKINPADVVAIPTDYNNSKGRACKYEVVGEIPLNEYKMPEYTLDENFTAEYGYKENDEFDEIVKEEENLDLYLGNTDMTLRKLRGIREDLENGLSYNAISKMWDISPRQVGRIHRGEAWSNVK